MVRVVTLCGAILLVGGMLGVPAALAQTSKSGATATKPAQAEKALPKGEQVDLNTATQAELEALPGIGPATAKKIIAGRPYASVKDLSKAGVSAKTMDKIAPMVTVGAPASAAPSTPRPPAASKASEVAKSTQSEARVPPAKGMVWVNTKSGVFHSEGDRWYGKTKEGKFMTEADALKAGYRAAKEGAAAKKQ
jgi:helix-hairpin-helix protein